MSEFYIVGECPDCGSRVAGTACKDSPLIDEMKASGLNVKIISTDVVHLSNQSLS